MIRSTTLFALLALAACGTTTRFAPLNAAPRRLTPKPAEAVILYSTALPAQPYVEVGIVQGTQESDLSVDEMPQILAAMRVEAGRRGCDALVLNGPNNTPTTQMLSPAYAAHNSTMLQGFWATCIAFIEPSELAGPTGIPAPQLGPTRREPVEAPPPPAPPAAPQPDPQPPRLPPAPTEPSPPSQ